ncbi:MAG: outer membrane beta-barrel protein [candidate division Zixibacteria bacterium]|nr:outer membrane beta-barrel protein [candidate division Zixibacteria bacterium]
MKKVLIFAAIFMFGAFSMVSAQADLQGMFNVSPFGGLGLPMGDMSADDTDDALNRAMGFKFGVMAEYFFTPNIGVGVDFLYAIFGNDYEDELVDDFGDDKLHTMNIGVHGKYVFMMEGMLRPYVTAGAGMTMNKVKDVIFETGGEEGEVKLDSKIFIAGGVGAMYWVSEMISVFGEVGIDYLMTDGAGLEFEGEEVAGEIGTNYYFLDFKVGINIWFGGME